jgi:hypothetical protein
MQASVHEAKTHFSKLLKAVARGERVVITRPRIGSLKGQVSPRLQTSSLHFQFRNWPTGGTVSGLVRPIAPMPTSSIS